MIARETCCLKIVSIWIDPHLTLDYFSHSPHAGCTVCEPIRFVLPTQNLGFVQSSCIRASVVVTVMVMAMVVMIRTAFTTI